VAVAPPAWTNRPRFTWTPRHNAISKAATICVV